MAPLPEGWGETLTGEPMPNVVAAVRRSRESHYVLVCDASLAIELSLDGISADAQRASAPPVRSALT